MSTGGAREKQTTLNFIRSSQTDNPRNSQSNASGNNTTNAGSDDNNHRSKRNRLEFEQPEVNEHHHLQVPDTRINASDSNSSLFSSESNTTVIDRQETLDA